jgi:replicative DNA helicase
VTAPVLDFDLDRPLPQWPDGERAVLGAVLIHPPALRRVASALVPEDFFRDGHQLIWSAFLALDADGIEADLLTTKELLARDGNLDRAGGAAYISSLIDAIPDIANVEFYARGVREKSRLRQAIKIGNGIMRAAFDHGARSGEIVAKFAERLQLVQPSDTDDAILDLGTVAERLFALYENGGVPRGALTGWPSLDPHYTVAPGAWTLITGIPGHGKSGFLDALCINLAKQHGWQSVMFSAENYPPESHLATMLEKYLGEPFNEGPTARMSPTAMKRGVSFIAKHFRFLDPAAERMTVDRILALASALSQERKLDVLTIDPWNELQHDRAKDLSETEYTSVALTKIRRWARQHEAHVFLVAHPTKMQKDRDTGKYGVPTPYDVSGSAHWRNKADYCLTVYRDITTDGDDPNVQIHVQKVRRREMGRLGMVTLRYDKVTSGYSDPGAPRERWIGDYSERHEERAIFNR